MERRGRAIAQLKIGDALNGTLQMLMLDIPPPPPKHVLIKLTHRPINPSDLNSISIGRLFNLKQQPPILGCEGCGIIKEIGEGVEGFKVNDRVIPLIMVDYYKNGCGSWQDYIILNAKYVIHIPKNIPDEVAAQFVINPWTTYGLLDSMNTPLGEYLIQTAAASVLGRQVIQLAKHNGIRTINIVRRKKWINELKSLGADEVINSSEEGILANLQNDITNYTFSREGHNKLQKAMTSFSILDVVSRVKEITKGKMAHGALDAVGGTLTKDIASSVRNGGTIFVYGVLSGWDVTIRTQDLMRGIRIEWWLLSNYANTHEKILDIASHVMELLSKGTIRPLVGKTFALEDYEDAIIESKKEGRGGKVLLIG